MEVITADFETYYDKEYSLKKMTTEAYIRDPQFEVIMLGLRWPDGEQEVLTGTHEEIRYRLDAVDWSQYAILCHNTLFDAAIFSWHFGVKPRAWLDTLSMARAMFGSRNNSLAMLAKRYNMEDKGTFVTNMSGRRRHDISPGEWKQYAEYCLHDVRLCHDLWHLMSNGWYSVSEYDNRDPYPIEELRLIDQHIRMFTEPMLRLNKDKLVVYLDGVRKRKEELLSRTEFNKERLSSNPQFAEVLRELGVDPPMKTSKTTGKPAFAFAKTDPEFKALLDHPDERVQAAVAARLGAKSTLEETRTQTFIDIATRNPPLPVPLKYSYARTKRSSGGDGINLQNLPAREGTGLKACIEAPPGYVLIDCDSSNIEARVLAWLAEQNDLVQDFADKVDVYCKMASRIYGRQITKADKQERFVGKTVTLGCFGPDTQVLTDSGWKSIVQVSLADKLWDGEAWVAHSGLLNQGFRWTETPGDLGLTATADHEILTEHGWRAWSEVHSNRSLFQSALTYVLSRVVKTYGIDVQLENFSKKSPVLKRRMQTYDIALAGPRNRFTVLTNQGPIIVHNCGYQTGASKLQATLKTAKPPMDLDISECERIIDIYRNANPRIKRLWYEGEQCIESMHGNKSRWFGREGIVLIEGRKGVRLPSGLYISYPQLHRYTDPNTMRQKWAYKDDKGIVDIYGGKLVENCLAAGTQVLTDRGWVSIESVRKEDLVHDGVEFVAHGGTVFKSVQTCVIIDGVFMTPDHEVLTNDGWIPALQNPKPYRPDLRHVDSAEPRAQRWEEAELALSMSVRDAMRQSRGERDQGGEARRHPQLRLLNKTTDVTSAYDPRDEQTSGLRGLAQYVGSLPTAVTSGMEQLRGTRNKSLRTMAGFREFLVRHGFNLRSWSGFGSSRQQRTVFAGELSMDGPAGKCYEQKKYCADNRCSKTCGGNRNISKHDLLQTPKRLDSGSIEDQTRPKKPVYDIINAGPRQRFVVMGSNGPFIVHNCVQALARIVVMSQLLRIAKKFRVALTVHDSIIALAREDQRDEARAYVESCMRWVPPWAKGLPINCESKWGYNYGEMRED